MRGAFVGRLFKVGRLRRGMVEFLLLPLVIAALFCAAAVLLAFWDNQGSIPAVRHAASVIIPASGATAFIGAVAASLMAVTSITFSVLLIAVQQTSSYLGAGVFDQYLRRRANQVYIGYFVGATAFSFITFASAGSGSPPMMGAFAALLLTVGSLVTLLLLIHSTVDQMRPECVVSAIHDLAVSAHESELFLLTGTRRERRTAPEVEGRIVTTRTGGYLVDIDVQALADIARSAGAEVEMFLPCELGAYLELGETAVTIVGLAATDDRFDARTCSAFTLDDTRRVEVDSGYSIDKLENIAWMAASSAQSPSTASAAIHQMRDLIGRWAILEEETLDTPRDAREPLPVVYTGGGIERVISGFGALLIGSSLSRQADVAALLITSFAHALPRLHSQHHQDELIRTLDAALPSVTQHAEAPVLVDALAELVDALTIAGRSARRVQQVQAILHAATERLLPDPSALQEDAAVEGAPRTTSTQR
jgi:uncharacterized membrane protein